MDAQMKKGVLEMCILYQLRDEPLYGYEVMKAVRQVFPDVYEGSIYTVLRRLNNAEHTAVTLQESSSGPTRKYYSLTASGQVYLHEMLAEWRSVVESVASLGIK